MPSAESSRGRRGTSPTPGSLTVAAVVRNLADAPEGSSVADRWNWWLGALNAAYDGYREFEVRAVPREE